MSKIAPYSEPPRSPSYDQYYEDLLAKPDRFDFEWIEAMHKGVLRELVGGEMYLEQKRLWIAAGEPDNAHEWIWKKKESLS